MLYDFYYLPKCLGTLSLCCNIATMCRLMHERHFRRSHGFVVANETSTMRDHFANLFK